MSNDTIVEPEIAVPEGATHRTRRVVLGSFALLASRAGSVAAGIVLTGLVARYLSPAEFGLWAVLTGLPAIAWSLDLGLGNALRNRLAGLGAELGADGEGRRYFFSAARACAVLAACLAFLVLALAAMAPWQRMLQPPPEAVVTWAMACVGAALALSFQLPLGMGAFGFYAYQETHVNAAFQAARDFFALAAVGVFAALGARLGGLVGAYFVVLLAVSAASFRLFVARRGWSWMAPPWKDVWRVVVELAPTSGYFFLLQVSSAVILYTDTILVTKVAGLAAAGEYALVQKLFLLLIVAQFFILTPLWSAYTQASARGDRAWMRKALSLSFTMTSLLCGGGAVLLWLGGPLIIRLWTGKTIAYGSLFPVMALWAGVYGLCNCFSVFLNALGRLKRQALLGAAGALANIPLALWLGGLWGPVGVCWAGLISMAPAFINNPLEALAQR
jgi:O-antigen/teichoic acid export membrane protein